MDDLPESVEWFVPLGLAEWFRERDRPNVTELGWWQSAERGRWKLTCLPSQHWSRRLGQGTNETLWCSWLLDSGEYRYYFAGDTGYFHGFREYGGDASRPSTSPCFRSVPTSRAGSCDTST